MALLGEAPSLAQTTSDLTGPIFVLGLFAGDGIHGVRDAARLVAELDRPEAMFAGTIANLDGVERLVASAVGGLIRRNRFREDRSMPAFGP
jgi:hypothetical protein